MAKTTAVWGIDLGQCALKALRCKLENGEVVADAFDYIEYPKILSQPEAEPEKLVTDALEQFLSRNDLKGDKVAISLPGQAGLARFFKPPPVDAKKIPDIVKYEARQQIPFDLEEVIWDYQKMGGGVEVEGFSVDAEIGLFAMKKEQVYRLIEPFVRAGIELDVVQLAPFSIYNFIAQDVLHTQDAEFDPHEPPESLVVLSTGTETTDLVITNGFRLWQRSIPLGGNHFTKQLTKELKLTFAKAEHVKRNARQAEDPKTVFQAMRPVFTDLVTEVQRSVGYFQSLDRSAKIKGVVVLGNTVKLPGLQEYLAKNLGYEVVKFKGFEGLEGADVLNAPTFKDNQLSFAVSYGLCLQGLGTARLQTNLIPREILVNRLVKAKKPWVVATLGALILACTMHAFFTKQQWYKVQPEFAKENLKWEDAERQVSSLQSNSQQFIQTHNDKQAKLKLLTEIGKEVVGNRDRRLLWLEVLRGVNAALPTTEGIEPGTIPDVKDFPYDKRKEIYVTKVETQYFEDLSTWFTEPVKKMYIEGQISKRRSERGRNAAAAAATPVGAAPPADGAAPPADGAAPPADGAAPPADGAAPAPAGADPTAAPGAAGQPAAAPNASDTQAEAELLAEVTGPQGAGWVIEMEAHHFFNSEKAWVGDAHVRATLIKFLEEGSIELPITPDDPTKTERFTLKELGIDYVVSAQGVLEKNFQLRNPEYDGPAGSMNYGGGEDGMMGPGMMGPGMSSPGMSSPGMSSPGMMGPGMSSPGMMGPGMGMSPGMSPGGGMSPGMSPRPGTGPPGAARPGSRSGAQDGSTGEDEEQEEEVPAQFTVPRYDFVVQFVWQEQPLSDRLEQRRKELEEKQNAAAQQGDLAMTNGEG